MLLCRIYTKLRKLSGGVEDRDTFVDFAASLMRHDNVARTINILFDSAFHAEHEENRCRSG